MKRYVAFGLPCLTAVLVLAGCRSTVPAGPVAPPVVTNTLPVPDGIVPLPPVTAEPLPGMPPLAPGQTLAAAPPPAAAQPCEPPTRAPWWKGWLPTRDGNDPSRERGQFKDGFYEPEYRGISD